MRAPVITNVMVGNGLCQDVTEREAEAYLSLADAVAAAGSNPVTLLVEEIEQVMANLTIPSTIGLNFRGRGRLNVAAGVTLTINGGVEAGLRQIFSGAGTVLFGGTGLNRMLYIQWFGGANDNSTDCSPALQAAHDAFSAWGGTIFFAGGGPGYRFDSTVAFTRGQIKLVSDYWSPAYIRSHTSDPMWTFIGTSYADRFSNIKIENLYFVPDLVDCDYGLQFTYVERPIFEHVYIAGAPAASAKNIEGITLAGTDPVSIQITGHSFSTGEAVWFANVGGTVELNNNLYVITRTDDDNFTLNSTDSSDYTAFTAGGTATQYNTFSYGFYLKDCNYPRFVDVRAIRCRGMGLLVRNNVDHADNDGFNLFIDDGFFSDNVNAGAEIGNIRSSRISNSSFNRNTFEGLKCYGNQDEQPNYADGLWLLNNEYDANGKIGLHLTKRLWVVQDGDWISSGRIKTKNGAYYQNCEALSISNVKAYNCGDQGLYFDSCVDLNITNLNSNNNFRAGIRLGNCTGVLCNNLNLSKADYTIATGGFNQQYGLYVTGATTDLVVTGCTAMGNSVKQFYNNATAVATHRVAGNNFGDSNSIASVANVLTLTAGGKFFIVTSTEDITSIVASYNDRIVTLKFSGTAATNGVVDGGNLKLTADFAFTPDDILTLVCDGTNWHEISRSIN